MPSVKVGDRIRIIHMDDNGGKDERVWAYDGAEGLVKFIDSIGQLHGTWGGLAVNPEIDVFEVIG